MTFQTSGLLICHIATILSLVWTFTFVLQSSLWFCRTQQSSPTKHFFPSLFFLFCLLQRS